MKSEFFLMQEQEMAPWIMVARAKRKRQHPDPPIDPLGWTEPRGPIELTLMDTGDFWPDIIGCGSVLDGLYVSEGVKRVWDDERIDYGKCFPATIVGDLPPALKDVPPPTYYWMETHVGVKIDMIKSGYKKIRTSRKTGRVYGDDPEKIVFVEGSWDGSDLFVAWQPPTQVFCTRRMIDLATKYRWTNFQFVPIEHAYDRPFHPGVPY